MNAFSLYGSFTIKEAHDIGKKYRARCKTNNGYEHTLTEGREYEIEITPSILPGSPLCSFLGDDGSKCECHLDRFDKE